MFWFRKGGSPRRYSFWAADAIYRHALARGDFSRAVDLLPDLIALLAFVPVFLAVSAFGLRKQEL